MPAKVDSNDVKSSLSQLGGDPQNIGRTSGTREPMQEEGDLPRRLIANLILIDNYLIAIVQIEQMTSCRMVRDSTWSVSRKYRLAMRPTDPGGRSELR